MERVECKQIPDGACQTTNCSVELVDRNSRYLTVGCDLGDWTQDYIRTRTRLYYRFNGNVYRKFLVDIDEDFCKFMSGKFESPFLPVLFKAIGTNTNINHTCPYTGNVTIRNLTISSLFVKDLIIPAGQYRFDVNVYDSKRNRTIIRPVVYFTVPNSRDARLDLAMG